MLPQGLFGLKPFLLVLPVALVVATAILLARAHREGFSVLRVLVLQGGVGVLALSGAKLFALAEGGWQLSRPLGDIVNYGWRYPGAIGGLVLGLVLLRPLVIPGLPLARYADWNALAIPAGHVILRTSCFLAGCCVGDICHGTFCVSFPPESSVWYDHAARSIAPSPTGWTAPVFPLHFAFAGAALAVFFFLYWFDAKRRFNGQTFLLFLVLHDGAKFGLEFLRSPRVPALGTAAAVTAGVGLLTLVLLMNRTRGRRPAPAQE